jgi:NAD(P)-dependent dehydrogenase (short-subunit alcohol dehydrogenase family)
VSARRVVITGAASGIGAATMAALRSRGDEVVGLDLNEGDGVIACDVRDQESVDSAVSRAIERLGGLDVLVNCAGVGDPQSAGAPPDDRAIALLEVNLIGPWRVTGAAMPALLESRGRVVNVASGLAHLTIPFSTAYCMSKRGLVAYSDALRLEYGDTIGVTTVYPGFIKTPIHDASAELGLGLDGAVPEEQLDDAVVTMVRAITGPLKRDLATTRRGTASYALLRLVPRGLVDRVSMSRGRRLARKGHFARSPMAREYGERLSA